MDRNQKIIVALLLLAIVFAIFSLTISLGGLDASKQTSLQPREGGDTANVGLYVEQISDDESEDGGG